MFPNHLSKFKRIQYDSYPTREGTMFQNIKPGERYDFLYRSLIPKKIDNLIVGG
ncbi:MULTISPECIES: hypothetical protein [Metabacillus]|uniref:Uncharacterized protein n=1 Tax=Metabacillus elymi TaxID=2745198 RepID=A0ABX6SAA8_9BACI|nr:MULTISPECIES: hypothetical protein [Metabacillus]QNF30188.1 hypothetical protein HUW50_23640 [Metabacillus sp. KUDC1714]